MSNDLISRNAVIVAINNLMESPYANNPQFGKERKEVMETVKAMCIANISTTYDLDGVIKQMEDRKTYLLKEFVSADKAAVVRENTLTRTNEIDAMMEIVKSGGVADE